jgi:hypothetical protein
MLRNVSLLAIGVLLLAHPATAAERGRGAYDALIAKHAAANGVPEALVRKVIMRESRGNAAIVGKCGCYGLMQIKPATARGLGYTGSATGLLDPDTNLTYGVRYLAGAYRAAGGNAVRAEAYYRSGYYHAAKRQRGAAVPKRERAADATAVTGSTPPPAEKRRAIRTAAASGDAIPVPVAAPRRTDDTIPLPVAAPRRADDTPATDAAPAANIPIPVAAPRRPDDIPASDARAAATDAVPMPVAAPHKTTQPRGKRKRAAAANPIAQWFASWTTPSAKPRRAQKTSAAARM